MRKGNQLMESGTRACNGWIPQFNDWEKLWTISFRKGIIHVFNMDKRVCSHARPRGMDENLEVFLEVVIPRLLSSLGGNYPAFPSSWRFMDVYLSQSRTFHYKRWIIPSEPRSLGIKTSKSTSRFSSPEASRESNFVCPC